MKEISDEQRTNKLDPETENYGPEFPPLHSPETGAEKGEDDDSVGESFFDHSKP